MAPIGKLYGFSGNSRFRRALAVATLAGLEVETDPKFTMKDGAWQTPEFLAKFPFGYLPAFEGTDGTLLQESGAIADYFTALAPNANLVPTDPKEFGEIRQWQDFADQEIVIRLGVANRMLVNRIPYNKPAFEAIVNEVVARLQTLDKILLRKTFIVGERLSVADIFLGTALTIAFTGLIDAPLRAKIPNVVRYANTVIQHPKIAKIFADVKFIEKQPTFQAPAKAEKPKKEKAEKAPKAEKAAPKKKEVVEEDEDLDLAPAEAPKPKNPLDLLPKSNLNLETLKREYSNRDTRGAGGFIEWFNENADWEGYSAWKVVYRYPEDLTAVFMSSNLLTGLFTRLEASRKYLFASMGVLGVANDSYLEGVMLCRGQDLGPVIDAAPDAESYKWEKLDLSKDEDKKYWESALAWDLEVDGKAWADGKNFK